MEELVKNISYIDAINLAIKEEMQLDKNVVVIAEDIQVLAASEIYGKVNKNRIRSTPISENSFTGMAVGAATTGLRPIVNLNIANFIYLAADQIINQASKLHYMSGGQLNVPIVIRVMMFHNGSNAAQHSDRPYSMFMNIPGLKIIAPSTPSDMKGLLKSAIRDNDPVLVFEDFNLYKNEETVSEDPHNLIALGKADIKKEGSDITIVSIAGCLPEVLAAADEMETEGITIEVIDPRTLVPLDKETILKSVAKTGRLIVVDYAHLSNSVASEIAAIVAEEGFENLKKPIRRICTKDINIPFCPELERELYPSKEKIVSCVKELL